MIQQAVMGGAGIQRMGNLMANDQFASRNLRDDSNSSSGQRRIKRRRYGLSGIGVAALLIAGITSPAQAAGENITLAQGTASAAGWQLNGNAAVSAGQFVLTPPEPSKWGSVFNGQRITLGSDYSFSSSFTFRISDNGTANSGLYSPGADGIVFTVQTDTATAGTSGDGIGYRGINHSLGIEFDTYQNSYYSDPDGNHVGIGENGSMISVQTATAPVTLEDGNLKYAWVDYDGSTGSLAVRVADSSTRPVSATMTSTVDLETLIGQKHAYVGFTSATGGAWSKHAIGSFYFDNAYHSSGLDLTGSTDYVPNTAPTADDLTVSTDQASRSGQLSGSDAESDPLTYSVVDEPSHGTVVINPDGTFTYTRDLGFVGSDQFTFWTDDANQVSAPATVTTNALALAPEDPAPSDPVPSEPVPSDPGSATPPPATSPSVHPTDPHEPNAVLPATGKPQKSAPPLSTVTVMTEEQLNAGKHTLASLTPAVCKVIDTRLVTLAPGVCKYVINGTRHTLKVRPAAHHTTSSASLRKLTVIQFQPNTAVLASGQVKKLRVAKRKLHGRPAVAVGRAFNAGMGNADLQLSQHRSRVIQAKLGGAGKIQIVGLGSTAPVSKKAAPNRTVTVYF